MIDSGQLLRSIKIKKNKEKGYVDAYPVGKRENGQSNAIVAIVHEYGREQNPKSKGIYGGALPERRWLTKAKKAAEETIYEEMENIIDDVLSKHGF